MNGDYPKDRYGKPNKIRVTSSTHCFEYEANGYQFLIFKKSVLKGTIFDKNEPKTV